MFIRLANRDNGPISTRVTDEQLLTVLKKHILSHWQIPDDDERTFFPAPQPVSLERRDLSKLIEYEYLVCAKSDGMRFLLICHSGNCYLTDRSFKFYKVTLNFKKELYQKEDMEDVGGVDGGGVGGGVNCEKGRIGGIFDGELVMNKKNKWQYVIHDCVNIYGKNVSKQTFPARYEGVTKLISNHWVEEGSEFTLASKQFFPFSQLNILNRLIFEDKLDHTTDGIIFTPKNKKLGSHTQYDLFKWKPRHLHTFDFKVVKNSEGIMAYVNKNGTHVPYAFAPKGSVEESIFLEGLIKNCPDFTNNTIVECDYDDVNDTYTPIKLRLDKTHPNSFFTVKKTLCNIKENINIEELIEMGEGEGEGIGGIEKRP